MLENLSPPRVRSSVLLVDDDDQIRKLVSIALRRAGYDITVATNGREALARISEATPDLVISDVMMPDLDGFSLLSHLRADPALRTIPVIMLTARGTTEDVEQGLGLGADDYLAKPFEMRELMARVKVKIERPSVPIDLLARDRQTGLLSERMIEQEIRRELARAGRSGTLGCLAYIYLDELPTVRERLGTRADAQIAKQITDLLVTNMQPLDVAGHDAAGQFIVLMPETTTEAARRRLGTLSRAIVNYAFTAAGERIRLTPTIGFATFPAGVTAQELRDRALIALDYADAHLDLQPMAYNPSMDAALARKKAEQAAQNSQRWARLREALRLPFQILLTLLIGLVIPFFVYAGLAAIGLDISWLMYIIVVAALLTTAFLIWIEGLYALRVNDPPLEPGAPYPTASAIIAAYLPNEAATVVETVEAFLRIEYQGDIQIILAYNTPRDMPIEATLQEIAKRDSRFLPLRVQGSTSKAQNVNAALADVRGEFVGVFDADHHPDPNSFTRAWRWLSNGYDVVQGHCLVRNGDETWVARLIAVEFEAIYAVSHPGRARVHNFGIFGGSNGYWKTDLLRQTRMHGFMLTEDIDSSLRVVEEGNKIASDPHLISRELAPISLKALWNQRMRWAQGWFQVSLKHIWRAMRSPHLTFRQKLGFFHLLGWREIYPWLSPQIFPIIAFWLWRDGTNSLNWFVPMFVLTSLYTMSVGPGQTLFSYLLSAPEIRQHKRWFVFYFVVSSLFYTEFKNLIARVAQVKEFMRERAWKVTPRAATAKPSVDAGGERS